MRTAIITILALALVLPACTRRKQLYTTSANALVLAQEAYTHSVSIGDIIGAKLAESIQLAVEPVLLEFGRTDTVTPDLTVTGPDGDQWGPSITAVQVHNDLDYARGIVAVTAAAAMAEARENNRVRSFWQRALSVVAAGIGGSWWATALAGSGGLLGLLGLGLKLRGKFKLVDTAFDKATSVFKAMTDAVKDRDPELYDTVIEPIKKKAKDELPAMVTTLIDKKIAAYKAKKTPSA